MSLSDKDEKELVEGEENPLTLLQEEEGMGLSRSMELDQTPDTVPPVPDDQCCSGKTKGG